MEQVALIPLHGFLSVVRSRAFHREAQCSCFNTLKRFMTNDTDALIGFVGGVRAIKIPMQFVVF